MIKKEKYDSFISNYPNKCPKCNAHFTLTDYCWELTQEEAGVFIDLHYTCPECKIKGMAIYDILEIGFSKGVCMQLETVFATHKVDDVLVSDYFTDENMEGKRKLEFDRIIKKGGE